MTLTPLNSRIVVRRDEAEAASKDGIVIPEKARARPNTGVVLTVPDGCIVKVGDRVLFPEYEGSDMRVDGVLVTILDIKALMGVFGPPSVSAA